MRRTTRTRFGLRASLLDCGAAEIREQGACDSGALIGHARRRLTGYSMLLGAIVLLGLQGSAPASAGPVTFLPAVDYRAGSSPSSATTGDLNNDGNPDLVVANTDSNNVTIRLGDGKGGFGAPTTYPAGTKPASVAVGDFNGDGNLDLVVADQGGGVSILLGDGNGGFGQATNYSAGTEPLKVAVGDFNKDGNLDLAVINNNHTGTNLWILLGDGKGGFVASSDYAVGECQNGCHWASSVAVGDFNRDGNLDLVLSANNPVDCDSCGQLNPGVWVLAGNGKGNFASGRPYGFPNYFDPGLATTDHPHSLAVADVNGDGRPDVVLGGSDSYSGSAAVSVLPGIDNGGFGEARFGPPQTYKVEGTDAPGVAVAYNLNGHPDIAVTNSNNDVSILAGDGQGGFGSPTNYPVGINPVSVTADDLNSDGRDDLIVANSGSDSASVLLNKTDMAPPTITIRSPKDLSTGTTYNQGDTIVAGYSCKAEPRWEITYCGGNWFPGFGFDASPPGKSTFTVTATDAAGNRSTQSVDYWVTSSNAPPPRVKPPRGGIDLNPANPPTSSAGGSPPPPPNLAFNQALSNGTGRNGPTATGTGTRRSTTGCARASKKRGVSKHRAKACLKKQKHRKHNRRR